jgi:hypothetical protein
MLALLSYQMLSSDQWLLSLSSTCLSFSTGNNAYISWKEKKEKETMLIVGCTNCAGCSKQFLFLFNPSFYYLIL